MVTWCHGSPGIALGGLCSLRYLDGGVIRAELEPRGTETPELLMGLAGIGYGLLRLAAPERVPSVLTLAMP